jgi:rhamnosyltransferase
LAHNNSFNREVCGKTALYFKDSTELAKIIAKIEKNPSNYFKYKDEAFNQVTQSYMWDKIIDKYYELFNNLK